MPFISLVNGTMTSAFALNSGAIPLGPGATAPLLNNAATPYVLNNPRLFDSSNAQYSSYTGDAFGSSIDSNSTYVAAGVYDEDQNTSNGWEFSTGGGAIYDANTGALLFSILNPNTRDAYEDQTTFNTYFNPNNINWTGADKFGQFVSVY